MPEFENIYTGWNSDNIVLITKDRKIPLVSIAYTVCRGKTIYTMGDDLKLDLNSVEGCLSLRDVPEDIYDMSFDVDISMTYDWQGEIIANTFSILDCVISSKRNDNVYGFVGKKITGLRKI